MAELNMRVAARSSILRIQTAVNTDGYAPDRVEIEQSLKGIETHYNRFVKNHMVLVSQAKTEEMTQHEELYAQVESAYDQICIKLRRLLQACKNESKHERDESLRHPPDMRLDPVSIPAFDGRPENWLVFKDMFETLVHNRMDLEPAFKLAKLRQYVTSENVPMIAGVYTGGYEQLWTELKRRYDNPRRLVETHVNRLLDLPDNAPDQQRALQDIIDCIRNTLRAMSVMKLPTDKWDAILYPILLRKLPKTVSSQWAMSLKDEELPKLDDIIIFIERRALNMPSTSFKADEPHTSGRRPFQRSIRANVATPNVQQRSSHQWPAAVVCPRCSGPHRIYKCQMFRNLSVQERWDTVKNLMLCFNCLSPQHSQRECKSTTCATCRQKHNTLLCNNQTVNQTQPSQMQHAVRTQLSSSSSTSKPSVIFDNES